VAETSEPADIDSVMDPLLYDIFNTESRAHLEVVRQFLARAATGDNQVDEILVRAVHTLHGSAHMADADVIADLAGSLEKLLKALMTTGQPADADVCKALEVSLTVFEDMLGRLPQEMRVPDTYDGVLALVAELCAAVPAGTGSQLESSELPQREWHEEAHCDAADAGGDDTGASASVLPADGGEQESPESVGLPDMAEFDAPATVAQESREEEYAYHAAEPETPHDERVQESAELVDSVDSVESGGADTYDEAAAGNDDYYAGHDEELLEIFLEEAGENLDIADAALGNWRASADDGEALAELQRALHTLKGGARMADLPEVGDVAHAVESLIITISENRVGDTGPAMDSVQRAQDCLAGMVDRVRSRQPVEPAGELVALLNDQRERAAEAPQVSDADEAVETAAPASGVQKSAGGPEPGTEVDPELLEVFLEEASDIMEHCEQTLQGWKRARDDRELMAELQRELHTLKGGARMSDITEIGDLAHAVESLMVKVNGGEVARSDGLFNTLECAQDRLGAMIERVRSHQSLEQAQDIIADLEKLGEGGEVDAAASRNQVAEKPAGGEAVGVAVAGEHEHRERRARSRSSQELIRVKADLLDNMVNYAGEVSIYRSRLEQQIGAYSFNLVEMEQTVARVREQLRKLEIETEAQVLYRYEREGELHDEAGESQDFDPLEMDRYSHMQQLSRSLMESVSDLNSIQNLLENITRESETLLLQQSRVNTELQEGLMRTRMVPFLSLAARMRRIVRQTSQELGKKAELELSGAEGEMDRTVVDRIVAPLEHMLRNAISHGIETPGQRVAAGKPETGTIRITLERESSDVVLRIADDGAGISIDAIRNKAIQRGLLEADSDLGDNEVLQFILETGFSTAEKVTQVAGRGVGMDVVNSEVKQLGGSLHIGSELGHGTTFTIRLPFTLALNQALLVEVGEDTYAIPLSSIEGIVRMRREDLKTFYQDPDARFEYGGYAYEVRHLGTVLGTGTPHLDSGPKRVPVLLARYGEHFMAFHVENLLGSREIVVKSVGPQISTVPGVSGATILGDGRVVMILEVAALLRGGSAGIVDQLSAVSSRSATHEQGLTVMVVDDSITVRKVTTRILERNDMHVIAAKDGVDAVSKLQENIPDIMLLDIEMPRMDGFELATHVRNEARLRDIPIIMITSRTGDKHRQRAMQIGVNRYLGKPFQESELLENIQALLEETAVDG
jgi:chemosensory pili system protein ChpA (sensor histidine kinase/response regulator)